MENVYIDIDGYWGIVVCWGYDERDERDMRSYMRAFGMSERSVRKAIDILQNYNTGMSVSSADLRMTCIFISKATRPSEFWNTAIHEVKHAADAIIEYYGAEWHGEDEAYLTGYIMKELVELIGEPCY